MTQPEEDFFAIPRVPSSDPEGKVMRAALKAHQALEHARAVRDLMALFAVFLGLPVWFEASWPGFWGPDFRLVCLTLWIFAFLGFTAAGFAAWGWERRRTAEMKVLSGSPAPPGDGVPPLRGSRTPLRKSLRN